MKQLLFSLALLSQVLFSSDNNTSLTIDLSPVKNILQQAHTVTAALDKFAPERIWPFFVGVPVIYASLYQISKIDFNNTSDNKKCALWTTLGLTSFVGLCAYTRYLK